MAGLRGRRCGVLSASGKEEVILSPEEAEEIQIRQVAEGIQTNEEVEGIPILLGAGLAVVGAVRLAFQ